MCRSLIVSWERCLHTRVPMYSRSFTKCAAAERSDPEWDDNAREAARLLEKAIAFKGDLADAYFDLGCLMDRKRDYPKAVELLEKSIHLKADDPVAHYRLARVYIQLGRKEQAAAEYALRAQFSRRSEPLP